MTEQTTNISLRWTEMYDCLVTLGGSLVHRDRGEEPTEINCPSKVGLGLLALREEKALVMKEDSLLGWL